MIVAGSIRVPGDKSITHRALLLAGLAGGTSRIGGALTGLDSRSTARVLRQLGVAVSPLRAGATLTVAGRGRLTAPASRLDCGNSGTTARLLLGLLAGHPFRAELTGDRSLRRRPMGRVTRPLGLMGARFQGADRLPLVIEGGALRPLRWESPVASAQVKSALLLAGVAGRVPVEVVEPVPTRDHTERLLRGLGWEVESAGCEVRLTPGGAIAPFQLEVPGDFSSAMFLLGAAALATDGELRIAGVGVNPTRTGALPVLRRMGVAVELLDRSEPFGEPVADLLTGPARLQATELEPAEVAGSIDEIPLLAALASRAAGRTRFREAGELRVKESDRLNLLAENLVAVGVPAAVEGDDLVVDGVAAPPRGRVRTAGDHRIAMAFAVLGTLPGAAVELDDPACADVSYPGFASALAAIGWRR